MESNIDFKNLSQYKYVYKFYMANNGLNIEKFKIVYINKSQIVYVENKIAKLTEKKYYHSIEEIPTIVNRAIEGWYKGRWTTNLYVISKEKINTESIKVDLNFKKYSIEQEISKLENEVKRKRYNIGLEERDIQRIGNKIDSLKLQINDLSKEGE